MQKNIEDSMILPMDLAGLTPQWLTAALSHRYPGVHVTSVDVDGIIVGTASKARLRIQYAPGKGCSLPESMYVKGGFHGPEQLQLGGVGYVRESLFFRHHAPRLQDLELPRSYFAATNADTGQSIVLLEDLTARAVTFGNATRPVSVDTAATVLEWQATLHGRFWNSVVLDELQPWPGVIKQIIDVLLSDGYWGAMIARPLAAPVPQAMRDPALVGNALAAMWSIFESFGTQTFIHGDAHLGNMYFLADGKPGYLDWQSPMRGPWSDDVTYFLIGSLTVADRRRNECELLRHYLDCLRTHIGDQVPEFDAAWLAYRRQVMHGFMWVATPPQMQPDEIVAANTERFCVAFSDLETLQALDF